jgi:hypothetical protein
MHQTTLFDKDIVSQKKLNVSNLVIGAPSWHVSSSSNDICSEMASALSPFQQLATSPSKSENNLLKHL